MSKLDEFVIQLSSDNDHNREMFCRYFYDINEKDITGNSLLQQIIKRNYSERITDNAVKYLCYENADVNSKNIAGDNFIGSALKEEQDMNRITEIMDYCCLFGFNINAVNQMKQDILHIALNQKYSFDDIATLVYSLISKGDFDFAKKDILNRTVCHMILDSKNFTDFERMALISVISNEILKQISRKEKNIQKRRIINFDDYKNSKTNN